MVIKKLVRKCREHSIIIIILLLVLSLQSISFLREQPDLWWDAAVYVGMGKYIYSSGQVGLWEANRPVVWPLILGFFWKLGVDEIFWGKVTIILFGAASVLLTYLIACTIFNKKTAILAALFLAFSPIFFLYTGVLQTEIPSTFFLLLGIYLFLKEKYILSGFVLGGAILTRFFQIFLMIPLGFYLLFIIIKKIKKKESIIALFLGLCFFLLPIILFLLANYFMYGDPFSPFFLQAFMTRYTGWIFYQQWTFYFIELLKENIFTLAAIFGIFFILKQNIMERTYNKKTLIAEIFLLGFIPFLTAPHKEIRLLIPLLPFLYIITSFGLLKLAGYFHSSKMLTLLGIGILWVLFTYPSLHFNTYEDHLDKFYDAIQKTTENDGIWISNPSFVSPVDKKADELIYYPLYNTEKIKQLKERRETAHLILLNTCDLLPCPPADSLCAEEHKSFMLLLEEEFETLFKEQEGNCTYFSFRKQRAKINNELSI